MKKNVYLLILIALSTLNVQQLHAQVQPRSQDAYWHTRGNVDLPENYLLGTLDAKPLYFVTNKSTRLYIGSTGNIGVGGVTDPHATLQLSNVLANKRLILWENKGVNNEHNFYGLGISNGILRYQVDFPGASHVFYAANMIDKATSSRELMRISGDGGVKIPKGGFLRIGYDPDIEATSNPNGGTIAYQMFSEGLDVVGAGASVATRKITMFAEGGTEFKGDVTMTGYAPTLGIGVTTAKEALHVSGKYMLLETPDGVSGVMGRLATSTGLYLGTRSEHGLAIGTKGIPSMYMDINGIVYFSKNPVSSWTANPPTKLLTDQCRLFVQGGVVSEKFYHIPIGQWADHVFENGYLLKDLDEVRNYIHVNKHLPGIPSQAQVAKEGYDMHEMNTKFLAKIEELTLYAISQKDQIDALQKQVKQYSALSDEISQLKKQLQNLQNK